MNFTALSSTELTMVIAIAVVLAAGVVAFLWYRKSNTERLRTKFGSAEYDRTLQAGDSRRHVEAALDKRTQRVEALHVRPLTANDGARFTQSWRAVQSRFIDSPAGAVREADQLLGDVMSTRGYPVSDFEQRAADISVDHPVVLEHYRTAHEIVLRQSRGEASTEDLRQAMVHYRTLFETLVGEPERPLSTKVAS